MIARNVLLLLGPFAVLTPASTQCPTADDLAIQTAINNAADAGGDTVQLAARVYDICDPGVRTYYGPTHKAFSALDAEGQQALHAALLELLGRWSRGNGAGILVPGEYLEVVVTK